MLYLLFIIIFSIFLLLKIPHPLQHLFQMDFFSAKVCTCIFEGNWHSAIFYPFSNSLGLCHELCVLQERCLQSILVKSLQISKVWHAWMMQTSLKTGEGRLELSFTCETVKINKWMRKTVHSKYIWYSAKVNSKTQCCCIFNALAKFHLQIASIYSCRSRMASPQESLLSGS